VCEGQKWTKNYQPSWEKYKHYRKKEGRRDGEQTRGNEQAFKTFIVVKAYF
jgi:hypothetical protein